MAGPFTITNITTAPNLRTIRLLDGRSIAPGKALILNDNEIGAGVLNGVANGWLSSVPSLPTDAASVARYNSTADEDPTFPQTRPSAILAFAGAIATPGVGFLTQQGNHKIAAAVGEGEVQVRMPRPGTLAGAKVRSTVEVSGGGTYTVEVNINGVKKLEASGGVAADGAPKIGPLTEIAPGDGQYVTDDLVSVKVDTTGRTGAWEGGVSLEG
jgi:hypothetical protein